MRSKLWPSESATRQPTKMSDSKATPKAVLMRRLREARKEAGLKKIEFWLTEDQANKTKTYVARLTKRDK